MSDMDRLFGSDSEDEGDNKVATKSGSNSPSGSSNSGSSSSGSDNESNDGASASPVASHKSGASSKSGEGSAPASPAASNSGSDSGSANSDSDSDSGSAKSASAPASPSHSGSAPASPTQSGSAPASPTQSGSAPASPTESHSAPPSPARSGSAPGSPSGSVTPTGSGRATPTRSGSPSSSKSGSAPGSPASNSSAGSKHSKSSKRSGSQSPVKQQDDSDSDIPTRGRARISDDSDDGSDVQSKPRQRLPSDSGSDPEAVRATAEDIFGEADDISEDERDKDQEPEEKEEVIPETRIEVEIPRVVADLGDRLSFAKLPNFLSVETRPFDPSTYEDEIDEDEVMDEEGRARLKLKVENTIRWRHVKDPTTGEAMTDEFGDKIRESNSKVVKWSDGSMSLHLGTEIFDVFSMPMQDHNHLYIRQGTGLQGQAMFKNKLSFRPHSTDSFTHRKMTMSLADRSSKTVKIKVLPIAGVDPELSKTDNIKKEEERLRASVRRENQQRRTRERGYGRGRLDASMLDEGVSLNAIKSSYKKRKGAKSRDEELSDSADEEYETDGEDDVKHNKLQKAKRLDDSDDNSNDSDEGSDGETVKKKSKVMSGSDSD